MSPVPFWNAWEPAEAIKKTSLPLVAGAILVTVVAIPEMPNQEPVALKDWIEKNAVAEPAP